MSGQNHQTLSRFTFWATIDTWWCHLLTSGAHVCRIGAFSDSTKRPFVFVFISSRPSRSLQMFQRRLPSLPGRLNIVAPPLSVFDLQKVETWNLSLVSASSDPADGTVSAVALEWTARGTCQSVTRAHEAAPRPPPGWAIESFGVVDASSSVSDRNAHSEHTHKRVNG